VVFIFLSKFIEIYRKFIDKLSEFIDFIDKFFFDKWTPSTPNSKINPTKGEETLNQTANEGTTCKLYNTYQNQLQTLMVYMGTSPDVRAEGFVDTPRNNHATLQHNNHATFNATIMQPCNTTIMQPCNATIMQPWNTTITQPCNATITQPCNATITQPYNATIMQHFKWTIFFRGHPKQQN
jgi:hypothetical protein